MEVFIFLRIRGDHDGTTQQLVIKMLNEDAHLTQSLARFDAAKAQCYLDRDKQKLLAVIEASFGTTVQFDDIVHELLDEHVLGTKTRRRSVAKSISSLGSRKPANVSALEV